MADNDTRLLRLSNSALEMLRQLATLDRRDMGAQAAVIIEREHARVFSTPNPSVTIEQAQAAQETRNA